MENWKRFDSVQNACLLGGFSNFNLALQHAFLQCKKLKKLF
jgi:hypothetical protein